MDRFAPIVSESIFTTSILFDASVNAGVIPLRANLLSVHVSDRIEFAKMAALLEGKQNALRNG